MELRDIGYGTELQVELKIIISRNVKFNELTFPCKINNTEENPKPSNPSDLVIGRKTQIKVEQQDPPTASTSQRPNTQVEFTNLDETSDQDSDHEDLPNNPEDDEHYPPHQDLSNYQLTRDQVRRSIRPPARYAYSDLVFCVLVARIKMRSSKPTSY